MLIRLKNIFYPLDKKDYYKLVLLFILILAATFLELVGISLIIPILTIFIGDDYLKYTKFIFFVDINSKMHALTLALTLFLVIYFLKLFVMIGLTYFQTIFSFDLYRKISQRIFKNYLFKDYLFHISANSSNLLRNVTSESNMYAFGLILPVVALISDFIIFISISMLLIFYSLTTSIIAIILFSITSYIIFRLTSFNLKTIGTLRQFHSAKMIKQVNEGLGSIKEIILYKLQNFFLKKFNTHNNEYAKSGKLKNIITDLPRIILEFVTVVVFISAIFFLIKQGKSISEVMVVLGVFAFASFRLLPSIVKLIKSFQTIKYNLPVLDLILKELKKDNDPIIKNDRNKITIENKFEFQNLKFKNLYYSYNLNEDVKNILTDINFTINKKDKVGIQGESGSGKTTLINLIIGLLNNYEGEIILNGQKFENNILNLQNKIGYIPQSVYLADESILFNITLEDEKNVNFEKLQRILSTVELVNFVNMLPDKIHTIIGERGSKLSGGQCQRIGIARALYREPSIIILDEATNALDEITENKILSSIFNKNPEKTIIIISHNKSALKYCNKIFEMNSNKLNLISKQ